MMKFKFETDKARFAIDGRYRVVVTPIIDKLTERLDQTFFRQLCDLFESCRSKDPDFEFGLRDNANGFAGIYWTFEPSSISQYKMNEQKRFLEQLLKESGIEEAWRKRMQEEIIKRREEDEKQKIIEMNLQKIRGLVNEDLED
jgi:hypothetical protein